MGNMNWAVKAGFVSVCLSILSLVACAIFRFDKLSLVGCIFAGGWIVLTTYGFAQSITKKWFYAIPLTILFLIVMIIFAFPGIVFPQ